MDSKPIVMNRLTASHTSFQVDFQFENNITILMGDSGVGKSVIFMVMQEAAVNNEHILCINYLDINKDVKSLIEDTVKKLIIIDNADVLLSDDIRKRIALDNVNQYLIIGRNPKNLLTTKENLFELASKELGNTIEFTLKRFL